MSKNTDEIILKWIIIFNGSGKPLTNPIKTRKTFKNKNELERFRKHMTKTAQKDYASSYINIVFIFGQKGVKTQRPLKTHLNTIPEQHQKYADWLKNRIIDYDKLFE